MFVSRGSHGPLSLMYFYWGFCLRVDFESFFCFRGELCLNVKKVDSDRIQLYILHYIYIFIIFFDKKNLRFFFVLVKKQVLFIQSEKAESYSV